MANPTMGTLSTLKASGATSLTAFIAGDRVKFRLTNCSTEFVPGYTLGSTGSVLTIGGNRVVGVGSGNTVAGVTNGGWTGTIISQSYANTGQAYYGTNAIRVTFTVEITYNTDLTAGTFLSQSIQLYGMASPFNNPSTTTSVSTSTGNITVYTYSQPSISSMDFVRCDSGGSETSSGTYVKVRASWTASTSVPGITASATFRWGEVSANSSPISLTNNAWSSPQGSGNISPFNTYIATTTVTDNANGSATATRNLGTGTYIGPSLSGLELVRCNSAGTITGIGTYLKFRAYWDYMSIGGTNVITATFTWGPQGGSQSAAINMSNGAWSSPLGVGSINILTTYQANAYVSASLGGSANSSTLTSPTNYVNPTITVEAVRCDSAGAPDDLGGYLKARGSYLFASVGGYNSASATFTWNQVGGTQSAPIALPAGNAWSSPFGGGAISIINTYYIFAQVTDAVGNIGSGSHTVGPIGYDPPEITNAEAVRCDSAGNESQSGAYIKVRVNYTYTPMSGANSASASFVWGLQGGTMSAPISLTDNAWSSPVGGSVDQFASYVVVVSVEDTFLMSDMQTIYLMSAGFTGEYWGFMSSSRTGTDYLFQTPIPLSITFTEPVVIDGLHFVFNAFDDSYCDNMDVRFIHSSGPDTVVNVTPGTARYLLDTQESDVIGIQMTFYSMNKQDRFLWIQRLTLGNVRVFTRDEIISCNTYAELDADGSDLKIGTLNFEVLANDIDETSFGRRKKVELIFNKALVGTYFIDDLEFTQSNTWRFRCVDSVGVLEDRSFDGGLYNGTRVFTEVPGGTGFIVNDISTASGVEITVSDEYITSVNSSGVNYYISLYGVLPVCTCRYALVQVAFAMNAIIIVNPDGSIYLKRIDSTPMTLVDEQRIMLGAYTKKEKLSVENVTLTVRNHSYKTGQPVDVYENMGSLSQSIEPTRVYFNEPVFADNFTGGIVAYAGAFGASPPSGQFIVPIEFNANFFGYTTSNTLTGWYVYAMKLVFSNQVLAKTNAGLAASENKTDINYDRYLLSVANTTANSNAGWSTQSVLENLFYLAMKNKKLFLTAILDGEAVGDTVSVETPNGVIEGIITKMNTNVNNYMISQMEVRC